MTEAEQLAAFTAGLSEREQLLLESERRAACEVLSTSQGSPNILGAARAAHASAELVREHHLRVLPAERAIACQEGCHWCCHMKVLATAPEVFALADYLRRGAGLGVFDRVKARAAALAQDPRIFSTDAKVAAKIPCAVLTETGACAGYEARPLACRGWNAFDAETCRLELEDDTVFGERNDALARECAAVSLGLVTALADAQLPNELLELTSALHIALSDETAPARWAAGEPVFARAVLPEGEEIAHETASCGADAAVVRSKDV
ncbi:MAG: YkgJ family cysteine cluster protein [Pseudomonadota bacterium]